MNPRRDDGSGSILAVIVIGAITAVMLLALPLYGGLTVRVKVAGAADAAALAAANVGAGFAPGVPCEQATRIAEANGAVLSRCVVTGATVTVQTTANFLGYRLEASATAGPPPGE